jgi:hypothetical protein
MEAIIASASVNDLAASGARPPSFSAYFGTVLLVGFGPTELLPVR